MEEDILKFCDKNINNNSLKGVVGERHKNDDLPVAGVYGNNRRLKMQPGSFNYESTYMESKPYGMDELLSSGTNLGDLKSTTLYSIDEVFSPGELVSDDAKWHLGDESQAINILKDGVCFNETVTNFDQVATDVYLESSRINDHIFHSDFNKNIISASASSVNALSETRSIAQLNVNNELPETMTCVNDSELAMQPSGLDYQSVHAQNETPHIYDSMFNSSNPSELASTVLNSISKVTDVGTGAIADAKWLLDDEVQGYNSIDDGVYFDEHDVSHSINDISALSQANTLAIDTPDDELFHNNLLYEEGSLAQPRKLDWQSVYAQNETSRIDGVMVNGTNSSEFASTLLNGVDKSVGLSIIGEANTSWGVDPDEQKDVYVGELYEQNRYRKNSERAVEQLKVMIEDSLNVSSDKFDIKSLVKKEENGISNGNIYYVLNIINVEGDMYENILNFFEENK